MMWQITYHFLYIFSILWTAPVLKPTSNPTLIAVEYTTVVQSAVNMYIEKSLSMPACSGYDIVG